MKRRIAIFVALSLALAIVLFPDRAEAADFRAGPEVTIEAGEILNDDLYAGAGTINVNGTINGDLIATGGNITVNGTINGDVIAAGGDINIRGPVSDDIRVAGGRINLRSSVGGDVIAAGGSLRLHPNSVVEGDLVVGTGSITLEGTVEGDAQINSGKATIAGTVKGDVDAHVDGQLILTSSANIEGNLLYKSRRRAKIESGAEIKGTTVFELPTASLFGVSVQETRAIRIVKVIVSRVQWFLGTALVGLLLLWAVPMSMYGTAESLTGSPWKSLGLGIAVLILAPVAIIISAAIAIFVTGFAGVPVAIVPGAAYFLLLALATPVIALVIGALVLDRLRGGNPPVPWQALLIGAGILAITGFVPILVSAVAVVTLLFGFGAWVLFLYRSYSRGRQEKRI